MRSVRRGGNSVSFTTRGSSVLAGSIAAGFGAVVLGETDLLRVAVAVSLVCIASWLVMKLAHHTITTHRRAEPSEAAIGEPIDVHARVVVAHRFPSTAIHCHDATSDGLVTAPELELPERAAREGVWVSYHTTPKKRGIHSIGPMHASVRDPFGLVTSTQVSPDTIEVIGLPRIVGVDSDWMLAPATQAPGVERVISSATDAELDVVLREHHAEDGLRRVHWPSSARLGRLMVRQDEPVGQRWCTIILDDADRSHRGQSFDLAVDLVASLAARALDAQHQLSVRAAGVAESADRAWSRTAIMRMLAMLEPVRGATAAAQTDDMRRAIGRGPTFLVLTDATNPDTIPAVHVGRHVGSHAFIIKRSAHGDSSALSDKLRSFGWNVCEPGFGRPLSETLMHPPKGADR